MTQTGSFTKVSLALAAALTALAACAPAAPPEAPQLVADPPDGASSPEEGAAETELQRGIAYIKNEKYDEAKGHLEKSLSAKPTAEAAYYLALSKEKLGDRAGAEVSYKRALEIDGKFVEAAANLSALYLDEPARPDQAITVLEDTVKKVPDDARLRQNLALAYVMKGNIDAASKQYDAALAKGENAQLRFAYGTMLMDAKQPDKAAKQLAKVIDSARDDAALLVTVGRLLGQAKAYGDCVRAFDAALKLKSTDPEWYVRRGVCRHELADEPGAQADYESAIKVDPKFAPAHYYMGLSFLTQNKRQSALASLEKAMKYGEGTPLGKNAKEKFTELAKKK